MSFIGGGFAGVTLLGAIDGSGYEALHHFGDGASDGVRPQGGLTAGSHGLLCGTTSGGSNPCGHAIKHYRQAWEYAVRQNPSRPR